MTGLRCEFKSGRPEASAQLHRIKKNIASMKAFMNQDSDQEASRQDNDDKTFDWPALDYPDMESVIKYVEQRKDEEVRKAKELWSKRVSQEIMESNVGMESNNQFDVKDHWVYSKNRFPCMQYGPGTTQWQDLHYSHRVGQMEVQPRLLSCFARGSQWAHMLMGRNSSTSMIGRMNRQHTASLRRCGQGLHFPSNKYVEHACPRRYGRRHSRDRVRLSQ